MSKSDQEANGARLNEEEEDSGEDLPPEHKPLDKAMVEAIVAEDDGGGSVLAEMLSGSRSSYDEIQEDPNTQTTETESDSLTQTNTETESFENEAHEGKKGYLDVHYCVPHIAVSLLMNSMDVVLLYIYCFMTLISHIYSRFSY
ncbi:uncharacterized protein LOC134259247 [Saccostrea cucullata]|uniref:uncharacterized protein LOC134259247 n=1 Tax=Saccostrea cuccullata TaxID=36930 RepID=UPI002ED4F84D